MTLSEQVFAPARRDDVVPVLATARLVLRAPRRSDGEAIAALANDRRIAANTARIPHPYAIEDAEQFIAAVNKREGEACFAVTLDGAPIGVCSVDLREDGPEVGYWLGVPYWGRGFATEAVRALIDHAFGDLEHETLISGSRVNNPASRRVLEKCGFQWTGVRLSRIRAINSAAPIDRFRLDRGLWASLKSWGRVKRVV
ncbi:MAG TPA: GNAT family N-acetyltransferase [Xanthobacteraceae bacterium]|nr:GNAT family N-acetyltransferase [Xanthobacteraceae bacterium]